MENFDLLDEDGYPTDDCLTAICKWKGSFTELMKSIKPLWNFSNMGYWTEYPRTGRTVYHLSTAGWSGNESIIRQLERNRVFWSMSFCSHHRGGHYVFEIRDNK
jgi:hypothetical protein